MSAEVFSEEDERLIVSVVLDICKRARDGDRISPEEADIARKVLGQMVAEDPTVTAWAKRQAMLGQPAIEEFLASIKEQ